MTVPHPNTVGLITASPADPNIGTPLGWFNPYWARIIIQSITFTYQSSSSGSTRHVLLHALDGNRPFGHSAAPAEQPTLKTYTYHFSICTLGLDLSADHDTLIAPLSHALYLDPGEWLVTDILNFQTNDLLSNVYIRYHELLHEPVDNPWP